MDANSSYNTIMQLMQCIIYIKYVFQKCKLFFRFYAKQKMKTKIALSVRHLIWIDFQILPKINAITQAVNYNALLDTVDSTHSQVAVLKIQNVNLITCDPSFDPLVIIWALISDFHS